MHRREFLTATVAGATGLGSLASAVQAGQQLFEWRRYYLNVGPGKAAFDEFLKAVAIPAMNRIGIAPVGAFNAVYGPNQPTLHVLMVHKSLESVLSCPDKLLADPDFAKSDFVNRPLSEPGYVRVESSLMLAFKDMPQLAVPEKKPRIFELRIYESHDILAAQKKIHMFNEGGEIAIFKKTGLSPVFFGQTLIGPQMPNLHYMLTFDDLAHRDKQWDVFRAHPDWQALKAKPEYKDTVSNITDLILKPTAYSQI